MAPTRVSDNRNRRGRFASGTHVAHDRDMKNKLRVVLALAAITVGCGAPDRSGEKGVLGFRFGLGGCASVPASEVSLANGGVTDLLVTDDSRRKRFEARTDDNTIIRIKDAKFELMCVGDDCGKTQGALPITAYGPGATRVAIYENDTLIDAITVRVVTANSITVSDKDGNTKDVHTRIGTPIELKAVLKSGDGKELAAKRDFVWSVEQTGLGPASTNDSRVTFEARSVGVSTVEVKFGELGGRLQVTVDP